MIDKTTFIELVTEAFYMGYHSDESIDTILNLNDDVESPEFKILESAYRRGHNAYVQNEVFKWEPVETYLNIFLKENDLVL